MKKALPFSAPRKTVLLLVLTAVLLTAVFCSLTFVRFSSQLYIKRSPNTFVGDEKYLENRAVVEQELETLRSQGVDGEIAEEVIERVNSKNEKTSLVIFTINAANTRNGWDLLSAGVRPDIGRLAREFGCTPRQLTFCAARIAGRLEQNSAGGDE